MVGSNTTQYVMGQFTQDVSGNLLGSFDAVNPVTGVAGEVVTAAKTGITRPPARRTTSRLGSAASPGRNGSGAGATSLRQSLGSTNTNITTRAGETVTVNGTTVTLPGVAPQGNCIDLSRSSSGPASSVIDPTAGSSFTSRSRSTP